ncbi:MAG TPA: HAMP domain-containing sensor histidine kinase [Kofleriaceae bacterium]|nr:HAMP domain-containing sensor histidine kinase [Kofleriaceae bacterium]
MEARALIKKPGVGRVVYAAALLGALLAALLGAWFVSGWHDVRLRQEQARTAPVRAAEAKADELGRELRTELEALIAREVKRPYFHYQNLMHDPRASVGVSVSPSPLAQGPEDPLVAGYFQIDSTGRATTPTINDDVPDLSEPENLAGNRAFRDQVTRDLVAVLTPPKLPVTNVMVAVADPPPGHTPRTPPTTQSNDPNQRPGSGTAIQAQQAQVYQIDSSSYAQNNYSNSVYWQQRDNNNERMFVPPDNANGNMRRDNANIANGPSPGGGAQPANAPNDASGSAPNIANGNAPNDANNTPRSNEQPHVTNEDPIDSPKSDSPKSDSPKPVDPPRVVVAPKPAVRATPNAARAAVQNLAAVTITVSALTWQTLPFGGTPGLIAVRQVQTPDGNLTQGLVIDRSTLTSQLAGKAGEMVAELHLDTAATSSESTGSVAAARSVEIAPGWQLTVSPNPRTILQSARDATDIARSFLIRFILIGVVGLLVACAVLWLVMRAEALAKERSQFAAAAAHELRTPLAGLQLYGDMLADGLGDQAKVRDYARRMSEEASRLGRVVSNVLGFSQLERGNLSVDPQVGPLGEALSELADRAQPALDRAGAVLDLDVAPDIRAKFDRDALARVIGNLLDNAEKYTRDAEDRTIRLAAVDKGDVIDVIVSDKGPGVAKDATLFKAFSRGVPADGPAGLGLGLALSRSLAQAMGGELLHTDADGGGAAFTLRLPRA